MISEQMEYHGIPPLLTCPADVWDLILRSLSPADMARLCLINESMRGFIEPHLYANLRWAWTSDNQARTIVLCLRSLVRRPQLGLYVRSLALMWAPSQRDVDYVPMSVSEKEELSTGLPTALINVRGPLVQAWIDRLHAGEIDALVALLLSRLPSLISLHLGPRFTKDNSCLGLILRSALCDPVNHGLPNFQHLRTVTLKTSPFLESARAQRQKNIHNVLSFFYLPSIERISASIDSPEHFRWPAPGGEAPVSLHLTELDVTRPCRAAHLGNVLSVAPNLKSLRWDWFHAGVTSPSGDDGVIDLDQIAAALSLVRESITELIITAKCTLGANKIFPEPTSIGSMKILADFPRMKSLQAPIAVLAGWALNDPHWVLSDVVPKTIESVTIMDDLWFNHQTYVWNEQAVLDVIKAWLANPAQLSPNLRHCSLLLKNKLGLDLGPEIDELKALGARVGVTVDVSMQPRKCSLKHLRPRPRAS